MDHLPQDRQNLLDRLLDAVKQCQVRFGGRTELATDNDSRVSCLCAQFEMVLQHGLKRPTSNPLTTLKQITGFNVPAIPLIKTEQDPVFWPVVRENLTKHELQRYTSLRNITTDAGRARAWLRSTLNEHSLERYLHSLLAVPDMLRQYYEPWAFVLDEERSSMIPIMARGLCSILFAINIDKEELNGIKQRTASFTSLIQPEVVHSYSLVDKDQEPVIATSGSKDKKDRKKKKKKMATSIVSFSDIDSGSTMVCSSPPSHFHGRLRTNSTGKGGHRDVKEVTPFSRDATQGFNTSAGKLIECNFEVTTNQAFDRRLSSSVQGSDPYPDWVTPVGTESDTTTQGTYGKLVNITQRRESDNPEAVLKTVDIQEENGLQHHLDDNTNEPSYTGRHHRNLIPENAQPNSNETSSNLSDLAETRSNQTWPVTEDTDLTPTSSSSIYIPRQTTSYSDSRTGPSPHGASFPGKTPPSTPHDPTLIQQPSHCSVDAESLVERLRHEDRGSSKTCSESSSSFDLVDESPPRNVGAVNGSGPKESYRTVDGTDNEAMYPVNEETASQPDTQSTDSSMLAFGVETENAALGLLLAQKSLKESMQSTMQAGNSDDAMSAYETMSNDELRQAVLVMMNRNDELIDQNRSLRSLLDNEMEHTGKMRGQLEEMKHTNGDTLERLNTQLLALTRENEVLKHQLKKYVGAVQLLRRDGSQAVEGLPGIRRDDPQPPIPEPKYPVSNRNEESEYERKLIQVAEMHGELMEFNDYLTRQLKLRDNIIKRLTNELVDLRGPLPRDKTGVRELFNFGNEIDVFTSNQRALVNIWIPSAFLRGKPGDAYHVYQIYIRIRDEEWNVYKRYTAFRELHLWLRKNNPIVHTFDFPPKKAVGNKDLKFVEERRKKLQHYIRCVVNFYVDKTSELTQNPCKEALLSVLPFFKDEPTRKSSRGSVSTKSNKLVAGCKPETPTYDGL